MKLKTLGVMLVALLAGSALVFSLCLLTVASQFDLALRSINSSYSGVVLPLRQIDANTKNLRFHLYACFMHNRALPINMAHDHPITLHLDTIAAEIRKNQLLWGELGGAARQMPQADLLQLRDLYDQFYRSGVTPSLRAAQRGDWDGIVRPITATLSVSVRESPSMHGLPDLRTYVTSMTTQGADNGEAISSARRGALLPA